MVNIGKSGPGGKEKGSVSPRFAFLQDKMQTDIKRIISEKTFFNLFLLI